MTYVDRYAGGVIAGIVLAGLGVHERSATLVVAGAIPLFYVAYGALTSVDLGADSLRVERQLERDAVFPGDTVDVTLSVTNVGETALTDLRVADGVPAELRVVDGTPAAATVLRPGETERIDYTVAARRGTYEFDPARVRARSLGGTDVRTLDVDPTGGDRLTCAPDLEGVPIERQTEAFAGTVRTDTGGSGVEFHSTREYRSGDPVSRIDWRRLAKSGDLTTVNYRQHRAARVVCVVDARPSSHVSPAPGLPSGAEMCTYAAERSLTALLDGGNTVGAAAFGVPARVGDGPAWVQPASGPDLKLRATDLFETAAEYHAPVFAGDRGAERDRFTPEPRRPGHPESADRSGPDDRPSSRPVGARRVVSDGYGPGARRDDRWGQYMERWRERDSGPGRGGRRRPSRSGDTRRPRDTVETDNSRRRHGPIRGPPRRSRLSTEQRVTALIDRLSADAQVLLFTPVLDEFPVEAVRTLEAYGHAVTVVSPDVTTDETTGGQMAAVERHLRLEQIRAAGVEVIDWDRDRPLALALESALEGI